MGDRDLTSTVAALLAQGESVERVYLALLSEGATVPDVQRALAAATKADRSADIQQRTVRIVLAIGALLVGAGVFSFVAANWQGMPTPAKVALIVVSMVAASAAGWWAERWRGYRFTGEALLLLGNVIFGAGIFLIAQAFNVRGNWPDGMILWMIGALAMAYATDAVALYALAAVVGAAAAIGYPIALVSGGPEPFALTSPLLIAGGTLAALAAALVIRRLLPPPEEGRW